MKAAALLRWYCKIQKGEHLSSFHLLSIACPLVMLILSFEMMCGSTLEAPMEEGKYS